MACVEITGSPEQKVRALGQLASDWAMRPVVRSMAAGRSIELLLSAVQLLPYVDDPTSSDIVCDPSEVIAKGGDCDDRAVLFAALAKVAGYRAVIVWQSQDGAPQDHVTVKVWRDGAWLWADPTVPGARIGEEPHAAVDRLGRHAERLGSRG